MTCEQCKMFEEGGFKSLSICRDLRRATRRTEVNSPVCEFFKEKHHTSIVEEVEKIEKEGVYTYGRIR